MNPFARFVRRVRYFLSRKDFDREITEEVRFHIERETEKNIRAGMSPREARRQAMIAFGGVDRHMEATREARGTMPFENAFRDVGLALRDMRRRPLYALGVAGTFALGLATAIVTFAVVWKVWLTPLPIPNPEEVVRLYEIEPRDPTASPEEGERSRRQPFSEALAADFDAHPWRTIEAVSRAGGGNSPSLWTVGGETHRASSITLNPEGFEILGIQPVLGRLPNVVETEVLLSERFWRSAFRADPDIVGSRVAVQPDWSPRIVGVVPFPSGFPGDRQVAFMFDWRVQGPRDLRYLDMIARIRPEYTVAQAEEEMNAFVSALAETHPEHRGWGVEAVALKDDLIAPFRDVLALLSAAGVIFLLLAGVNVLGLVAARRVESGQERSIRRALGASEGRLLRASIVHSLVLVGIGAVLGVLGAYWVIAPIRGLVPQEVPRLAEVSVSSSFAVGGLGLGLVLGGMIGLLGYLLSRGAGPAVGRAPSSGTLGMRGRRMLVVGQVALTTLLAAGGAAVLHRVSSLRAVDLGFAPEGVALTSAVLDAPGRAQAARSILDGLETRGITAAMALNSPMNGVAGEDFPRFSIQANGASEELFYELHGVTSQYFSLMGIEVLAGRPFRPTEVGESESVLMVNDEFVNGYFPSGTGVEEVVGRTLEGVVFPNLRGPDWTFVIFRMVAMTAIQGFPARFWETAVHGQQRRLMSRKTIYVQKGPFVTRKIAICDQHRYYVARNAPMWPETH